MTTFAEGIEDEARLRQPTALYFSVVGLAGVGSFDGWECSACGNDAQWIACESCDDGLVGHDCGEDTCACVDPQENVRCGVCDGDSGWFSCAKCGVLEHSVEAV